MEKFECLSQNCVCFLRPFLRSLLFPYLALSVLKRPSGVTQRITPDALKLLYFRELAT